MLQHKYCFIIHKRIFDTCNSSTLFFHNNFLTSYEEMLNVELIIASGFKMICPCLFFLFFFFLPQSFMETYIFDKVIMVLLCPLHSNRKTRFHLAVIYTLFSKSPVAGSLLVIYYFSPIYSLFILRRRNRKLESFLLSLIASFWVVLWNWYLISKVHLSILRQHQVSD